MKTLGLIGGMSWESTALYYRQLNEQVKAKLGGLHSAQLLLWSFDFDKIAVLQASGDWNGASEHMMDAGLRLKRAGADALMICTNTMHKMADFVEQQADLPLIHIVDGTAEAIQAAALTKVGLLATRFTMEQDFYIGRMRDKYGLDVIVPHESGRQIVHQVIYDELCKGVVSAASRQAYLGIIEQLIADGAEGIILGCTEVCMLISQHDVSVPVFDSTALHVAAAVTFALGE